MTEVLFYHLERQTLEQVLPGLLERSLERQWRVVVQAGSEERVAALDSHLWTYRDEAFLPHGTKRDGNPQEQPVWLTAEEDNPNAANVRFVVDGASMPELAGYQRVVCMFDGNDPTALEDARAAWRRVKSAGATATYWRQAANGRWEQQG
jgi:DNA polymerase-3 subunit chi